jgi:hypothetical protein
VKDSKVHWGEVDRCRDLDILQVKILPEMGFTKVKVWAVKPDWTNQYFEKEYEDCDRELINFKGLEDE